VVSGAPTLRPSRFGGFTFRLQPMDTERSDITGQLATKKWNTYNKNWNLELDCTVNHQKWRFHWIWLILGFTHLKIVETCGQLRMIPRILIILPLTENSEIIHNSSRYIVTHGWLVAATGQC